MYHLAMVKLPEQVSQKLTNANVFFTILIVWLHVSANYKLPEWVIGITVYSVPCFFAISSFLYFKSYDFNNPWADYKQKVSRRFNSLIVPFLIFNVVGFLFSLLCYQLHPVEHNPIGCVRMFAITIFHTGWWISSLEPTSHCIMTN